MHYTKASISHNDILNKGTNTHNQIDDHLADNLLHFTKESINISDLADTTITSPSDGQVLTYDIVIKNNFEKFHEICRTVLDKLSNMLKPIGYNVYGFDFIVQKNNNVMLLEVNNHAHLNFDDDEQERNISHVILNNIIDKLEEIIINKKYTSVDSILLKSGFFLNMNTKFVRRYN